MQLNILYKTQPNWTAVRYPPPPVLSAAVSLSAQFSALILFAFTERDIWDPGPKCPMDRSDPGPKYPDNSDLGPKILGPKCLGSEVSGSRNVN